MSTKGNIKKKGWTAIVRSRENMQQPEKTGEVGVSFKFDKKLLSAIDDISKEELRTRSATVRVALAHYVENHKRRSSKAL